MAVVLLVAAHPGDEVLGAGGTLARRTAEGDEVHVCILCEVTTSRTGDLDRNAIKLIGKEAEKAAEILGVAGLHRLGFADNRLDSPARLDIIQSIEKIAEKVRPEIVYAHHSGDLNIDHRIAFDAASVLARPAPGSSVREFYTYYIPSSTDWAPPSPERIFRPNVFVNIADYLETKLEALRAYPSEQRPWPHARSIEGVEHLCRAWGAQAGCEAAEAFWLVRKVAG